MRTRHVAETLATGEATSQRRSDVWLLGVEDQPASPRVIWRLACLHWRNSAGDMIHSGLNIDAIVVACRACQPVPA